LELALREIVGCSEASFLGGGDVATSVWWGSRIDIAGRLGISM